MKLFALLFLCVLTISPCLAEKKPAPLSADSVINLSVKAYARLKNYSDSGKLIKTFIGDHPHKSAIVFKTAFINTGDINFEYYEPGNSTSLYTINRTNNVVKTWWGVLNRTATPDNMPRALGAALGVSGGTSMIVPELLLTSDFKKNNLFRTLTKRTIVAEEKVNGKDCYKITGTTLRGPMTIWIAKKDFLIRKIQTAYVVDPAKTEAMVRKIETTMKAKGDSTGKERQTTLKTMAMIHKMDSIRGKTVRGAFTVNETFSFFPTVANKINPGLLKFRPNREVAL